MCVQIQPGNTVLDPTGELRAQVRRGFEASRGQKEVYAFKYSLSEGRTQLKQLRDMLGMRT